MRDVRSCHRLAGCWLAGWLAGTHARLIDCSTSFVVQSVNSDSVTRDQGVSDRAGAVTVPYYQESILPLGTTVRIYLSKASGGGSILDGDDEVTSSKILLLLLNRSFVEAEERQR